MALLDDWLNGNTFDILRDKVNAIVAAVNPFAGGATGQMLVKSSNSDFDVEWVDQPAVDTKDSAFYAFSGTQAMTGSYVTVGSLSHITPNDGISRVYQIIADADSIIDLGGSSPQYAYRLYNSTTATALSARSFALGVPAAGFEATPQNVIMYSGLIGPNETIEFQVHYIVKPGDMDIKAGSLMITEIIKF